MRKIICHAERSEASRMRLRRCLRDPSRAFRMTIHQEFFRKSILFYYNGIHTVGITSVACVTPDCQSASSITPAYTSGMTIKLCSLRNIAALLVRLLILQRED